MQAEHAQRQDRDQPARKLAAIRELNRKCMVGFFRDLAAGLQTFSVCLGKRQ